MTDDGQALLEEALALTEMSLVAFAEVHMVRDARTVRRWRSGEIPIPEVARVKLRTLIRELSG